MSVFSSQRSRLYHTVAKRFSVVIAIMIACALFVHAFDSCSSHFGDFANTKNLIAQISDHCNEDAKDNCKVCSSRDTGCSDSCDMFSEVAVRNSSESQSQLDAGVVISSPAILRAAPIELILAGSLDPRDGPAFVVPISTTLRAALPSRAPPLFI